MISLEELLDIIATEGHEVVAATEGQTDTLLGDDHGPPEEIPHG